MEQRGRVTINPDAFGSLRWRCIGPFRGGRVVAVAGHPREKMTFYMGSTGGGVWKTTSGGRLWENISDGFFRTSSVGAIAVSESDPNVIYVGMGECSIRGNVTRGDGVYKSEDGGRTWKHVGLKETRHIARVRIHPKNPDVVYVAALGHAFGPNPERGVYRSQDGGRTWELILHRSSDAGAIDLSMDPNNPRVLYAAIWEARRSPWELVSGGPGSGLFKSTDGGDTWVELTGNPGLPEGTKGKIGVAVSPADPDRVYALVEAEEGGLFRSDDGGATWQRTSDNRSLRSRAWYYTHVYADPRSADTVYVLNNFFWKSTDGGRTWQVISTDHPDHHDLWIDPEDTRRMIHGNDGGAQVSFDGGRTWSEIHNQPTAELYHVTVDNRYPYRVYGAQQDNSTISVPSRSDNQGITEREWFDVGGGESGYIAVRPDNPDVVYAGSFGGLITRYDHRLRQRRNIHAWPQLTLGHGAKDHRYRFQWTFPIVISPHDPDTLYIGGNHVFRTRNEGQSWEIISPDLTRNDVTKMEPSGGPITKDNTGVEVYGTVFTIAESPVQAGVIWAGSDDGLIHVSRDGGETWENVTPPDLPEWSLVSLIEASPHEAGTAYVAATRYKLDDFTPYLYRTRDFGKTWTRITDGIDDEDFTRCIREDPVRPGLLFAGTETGVYVSFDAGDSWQRLQRNLPVVPVHDLVIKDGDLVAATHGRSFWILDDITPLRQITPETTEAAVHLFTPRPTVRFRPSGRFLMPAEEKLERPAPGMEMPAGMSYYLKSKGQDGDSPLFLNAGQNPPLGVIVHYWLGSEPEGEVTLSFLDAAGNLIKRFTSRPEGSGPGADPAVPARRGANRFVWNMRYPDAPPVPGAIVWGGGATAPLAVPGTYRVRLEAGGQVCQAEFEIVKDPRVTASQEDLQEQFDLLVRIRDKLAAVNRAIMRIRSVREQLQAWRERAEQVGIEPDLIRQAQAVAERLDPIEQALIQVRIKSPQDPLNFPPRLNNYLVFLAGVVASADARPTDQSYAVFEELAAQADRHLEELQSVEQGELRAFNEAVAGLHVPVVVLPEPGPTA